MTKVTTEQDLYIKIKEAFNSASWEFREIPDKKVIEAEFEAHHAKVPLHAQSFEELMAISVVSRLSFCILPKSMRSALDALMRTNITLNLGNFEANPVNGEVSLGLLMFSQIIISTQKSLLAWSELLLLKWIELPHFCQNLIRTPINR